jgi:hypothetical protein
MRELLLETYLEIVRKFVHEETIFYIKTIRDGDKTIAQKLQEFNKIKSHQNYQQTLACINFVIVVCQLTNDNVGNHNHNRHIPDIMQQVVYDKLTTVFEMIA